MAYQMIHMEVAYRLLDRLPWIKEKADFILGSVAPDSVHMSPAYQVSMKEKSHLFNGSGEWGNTEDYGTSVPFGRIRGSRSLTAEILRRGYVYTAGQI